MVFQNASRMVFSHQVRDLECFADRYNIPQNLPTNFHSELIAIAPQMSPLSLCALLSQQSHLFLICVVRTMIPGKIFTDLDRFQGIVSVNDFRLPIGLQELLQASLSFLWSFCFAGICLDPLGGQVLHHDCISVIVSRFAIVTEDLVICCYQDTKNLQHEVRFHHCVFCTGPL